MLRIYQNTRPADAKRYYCAAYYAKGHELEMVGNWGGKGAAQLGLAGRVDQQSFEMLCDNLDPGTGKQLTPRLRGDRTVGYDWNFNAPKSVSLLYARYQDPEILAAFRAAIGETMEEAEREMKTRVRARGQDADRVTGNMLWSEFVHFTARPVEGVSDPMLHAHLFVFNATLDPVEQRWKAGQFRDLKRDAPYWEAAIHARLAAKLKELGYGIERKGKDWDVAGLSPALLKKFSRRTNLIEAKAAALGVKTADAKAALGAATREKKQKDLSWDQLKAAWDSQLTQGEREQLARVHARVSAGEANPSTPSTEVTADRAMGQAIQAGFERESVVPEKRLLAAALRFGLGDVTVDGVHQELAGHGILRRTRDGREMVTTRSVLEEERAMLAYAREGRGECRPLAAGHRLKRDWLDAGQQAAVRHVLESRDRIMVIRGIAGTGKTTQMRESVEAIEATGRPVVIVAPTAQAARKVLREDEGFAAADTVQRLIADHDMQKKLAGGVLWVDEAGLVGTRDMAQLFAIAAKNKARIVLQGDSKQHHSVPRGAALRLLEEQAGLVPVEIRNIRRQGGDKEAVEALAEGRAQEGFDRLEAMGWVHESAGGKQHERLAADYADAVKRGEETLVVSPTHLEGEQVTAAIREELKRRGMLDVKEKEFLRLVPISLTEAERADVATYRGAESPLVVQFFQNARGFTRGERADVIGVDGEQVRVRAKDGKERGLPLDQASRFQVFLPSSVKVAVGDKVRITQNGYTSSKKRLNNGSIYTVAGFSPAGGIRLDNGFELDRGWGHVAPGFVVTSHSSQGRTVPRVLIAASAESLPAVNREQLYVSASRGKTETAIYTDDKAALREAVARSDERLSATELVATARPSRLGRLKSHVRSLQRRMLQSRTYASRVVDTIRDKVAELNRGREVAYE